MKGVKRVKEAGEEQKLTNSTQRLSAAGRLEERWAEGGGAWDEEGTRNMSKLAPS